MTHATRFMKLIVMLCLMGATAAVAQAQDVQRTIPFLPAGKKVTVTWQARVAQPFPSAAEGKVSAQAAVTADNISPILSRDPDREGTSPTVTEVYAPSALTSTLLVEPDSLAADGSSLAEVVLTLRTADGALFDRAAEVVFSTTHGTLRGQPEQMEPGRYRQMLQSPTTVGTAVVSGVLHGEPVAATDSIRYVAGPVSLAHSPLTVTPSTLLANGLAVAEIRLTLKDAQGNAVTNAHPTVSFSTTGGTLLGTVSNEGAGVFVQPLQAPETTGTAQVGALVNGSPHPMPRTVRFVSDVFDPEKTVAKVDRNELPADGESQIVLTITLYDAHGNLIELGGDEIVVLSKLMQVVSVKDNGDGSYTVVLRAGTTAGIDALTPVINEVRLASIPITVYPLGRITGRVGVDSTAASAWRFPSAWLANRQVRLQALSGAQAGETHTATTQPNGEFTFTALPRALYYLSAPAPEGFVGSFPGRGYANTRGYVVDLELGGQSRVGETNPNSKPWDPRPWAEDPSLPRDSVFTTLSLALDTDDDGEADKTVFAAGYVYREYGAAPQAEATLTGYSLRGWTSAWNMFQIRPSLDVPSVQRWEAVEGPKTSVVDAHLRILGDEGASLSNLEQPFSFAGATRSQLGWYDPFKLTAPVALYDVFGKVYGRAIAGVWMGLPGPDFGMMPEGMAPFEPGDNGTDPASLPTTDPERDKPSDFTLLQNYPNPFNPVTMIQFELPTSSHVTLTVYDTMGRAVRTLVSGSVAAGRHTVPFDASGLSSGVYLYRLEAGGQVMSRKLTLLK